MKPVAIDLFCGLSKPELLDAANATIKKLVASGAQNPNHVPLRVGHQPPRSITLVLWLMRHFKNAAFSARLASCRQVGAPPSKSRQHRVAIRTARVVRFLLFWISSVEHAAKIACSLLGTFFRAITAVGCGWDDCKVSATAAAICSAFRNVRLFATPASSDALRALVRAIESVWPDSRKTFAAVFAGQIIHA